MPFEHHCPECGDISYSELHASEYEKRDLIYIHDLICEGSNREASEELRRLFPGVISGDYDAGLKRLKDRRTFTPVKPEAIQ